MNVVIYSQYTQTIYLMKEVQYQHKMNHAPRLLAFHTPVCIVGQSCCIWEGVTSDASLEDPAVLLLPIPAEPQERLQEVTVLALRFVLSVGPLNETFQGVYRFPHTKFPNHPFQE